MKSKASGYHWRRSSRSSDLPSGGYWSDVVLVERKN